MFCVSEGAPASSIKQDKILKLVREDGLVFQIWEWENSVPISLNKTRTFLTIEACVQEYMCAPAVLSTHTFASFPVAY